MAEGESATFDILSLANAGIAKCVDQIYPLLYPQMIGLGGLIFYIINSNYPKKLSVSPVRACIEFFMSGQITVKD